MRAAVLAAVDAFGSACQQQPPIRINRNSAHAMKPIYFPQWQPAFHIRRLPLGCLGMDRIDPEHASAVSRGKGLATNECQPQATAAFPVSLKQDPRFISACQLPPEAALASLVA